MPFIEQELGRTNLFLWARDWTGVTESGNIAPDWWLWAYFGAVPLADTNRDSIGNTLRYDYTNGLDPNPISFYVNVPNQYVNTSAAQLQITLLGGVPTGVAVLVDSTNFAGATWDSYTDSPVANLGDVEGWHQIWVGLRGRLLNSQPVWQTFRMKLDVTPPLLVVTNPASSVVSQPVTQLQGYCTERLAALSYTVSNATGVSASQSAFVVDEAYNTNNLEFTTNYFQAFDVNLTNGANTITFQATDLAGNTTLTNLSLTLDYSGKTNPPVVTVGWPQNATQIGSGSFNWRGVVSDPTVQVAAQAVDTNGVTNVVNGHVGRDGSFWVENIPLSGGTNSLTLTVTDVVGNTSTTNILVVQGGVTLTVDSLDLSDELAAGTVSDPTCTVWVNGVQAINYGDGTWVADNLELTLDSPVVQARAIPNSDNGGNGSGGGSPFASGGAASVSQGNPNSASGTDAEAETVLPDGQTYVKAVHLFQYSQSWAPLLPGIWQEKMNWQETTGGWDATLTVDDGVPYQTQTTWTGGRWAVLGDGTYTGWNDGDVPTPVGPPWEVGTAAGWNNLWLDHDFDFSDSQEVDQYHDHEQMVVITGGGPGDRGLGLFLIQAVMVTFDAYNGIEYNPDLSYANLHVGSLGTFDTNGLLWAVLPLHSFVDLALQVSGTQHPTGWFAGGPVSGTYANPQISGASYQSRIFFNNQDVTGKTNPVVVGQQIVLQCLIPGPDNGIPAPAASYQWTVPGLAISNYLIAADGSSGIKYTNFPTTNSSVVFYWVDGATNRQVQCTNIVLGQELAPVTTTFNVIRPTADWTAEPNALVAADDDYLYNFIPALHFGNRQNSTNQGMLFHLRNADLKGYEGGWVFKWAQFGAATRRANYLLTNNVGYVDYSSGLDTAFPGGTFGAVSGDDQDSPGQWLAGLNKALAQESFTNYLMFEPVFATHPSIPVPIKMIQWSWSGVAITNTPNTWTLLSSPDDFSIGTNNIDTMTIPEWNQNMTNYIVVSTNWF